MTSLRLRRIVLAVAIGCLAIGAAVAANIALLGLADRPSDRVGQLQLRLDTVPGAQPSAPATPALIVTAPPPLRTDDEAGPDD